MPRELAIVDDARVNRFVSGRCVNRGADCNLEVVGASTEYRLHVRVGRAGPGRVRRNALSVRTHRHRALDRDVNSVRVPRFCSQIEDISERKVNVVGDEIEVLASVGAMVNALTRSAGTRRHQDVLTVHRQAGHTDPLRSSSRDWTVSELFPRVATIRGTQQTVEWSTGTSEGTERPNACYQRIEGGVSRVELQLADGERGIDRLMGVHWTRPVVVAFVVRQTPPLAAPMNERPGCWDGLRPHGRLR